MVSHFHLRVNVLIYQEESRGSLVEHLDVRIGFSTTSNPLSLLIRKLSGATCSHTWFVFYDPALGCDMVMEANYTYQLIPFDVFEKQNKIVAVIKPYFKADLAMKSTIKWLGTWYDAKGLLGMLWVQLGRWTHHLWKNPFRSSSNVYCSEAVVRGLMAMNYPNLPFKDPETVRPDDILKFLVDSNIAEFAKLFPATLTGPNHA